MEWINLEKQWARYVTKVSAWVTGLMVLTP